MVQELARPAQANTRQTIAARAAKPSAQVQRSEAFAQLHRIAKIESIEERRAALESIAEEVQMKSNEKARKTWRGYTLWRAALDPRMLVLGLYTPESKRYRVSRSSVTPGALLWAGSPFQSYLNTLNLALRCAGSPVVVQSKHRLICWFLRRAEQRTEAGVGAVGTCPTCGGDLYRYVSYVGGWGHVASISCWHDETGVCNDWLRRGLA